MAPYLDCDERTRFGASRKYPTPKNQFSMIYIRPPIYFYTPYIFSGGSIIYSSLFANLFGKKLLEEKLCAETIDRTKFFEYANWQKDFSWKHIVCFGDSPDDLHHCYWGHERIDGGTRMDLYDKKDLNSIDSICKVLSKSNIPYQTIPPSKTNFIPNVITKLFGHKDQLLRYDIYYISNLRAEKKNSGETKSLCVVESKIRW